MHEGSTAEPSHALAIEESYETLYEEAPCGYLTTLLDGTIVRINRTMLRWTRYEREQLIERKFHLLLSVGSRIFYETHYAPLLAMQGAVTELALDLVRSDRTTFPALVNSVLCPQEKTRPALVRTMIFDATDRRSYERELLMARREAENLARVKAEFLAMLSHDLRTPLTAIMSTADLLSGSNTEAERSKYLELLKAGSRNILELVKAVLESSRLDSGRMPLQTSVFDTAELVRDIVERLRVKADEKGLELWCTVDERIPGALVGDAVKLSQVFTNLIANAIKFTDAGWIGVTVYLTKRMTTAAHLEATVMDTGIGIAPDRLGEVFEPFTQVHERSARYHGSVGLGLSITKKLVELHGGSIEVENRRDGGTLFRFTLVLDLPP